MPFDSDSTPDRENGAQEHLSTIDLALSVIQLSNDGDSLDPAHLALVQAAVNGCAKPADIERLRSILEEFRAGTYRKPWLQGVEPLTVTHQGHILYKQHIVEHYNHPYDPAKRKSLEELVDRCRHIEALGLTPSTHLAVFCWEWLKDLTSSSPQLRNALSLYELYRHTETGEIVGHLNYFVPGKKGLITIYRKNNVWRIHAPTDAEDDWISNYHGIQLNGFKPLQFTGLTTSGLSSQPLEQVLSLLDSLDVPPDLHQQALELSKQLANRQA